MGKPAETARRSLKSLSHSFTLDIILGFQHQADADRFLGNLQERLGSLDWSCIPIRRAGSSSAGLPMRTGDVEEKASPRRSTF